ncbi:sugar phosphate nucleotidyltransferase [Gordonia sp. (in: high G+C Gram-positive bacteria)]|uniref:sugar phosphate nucleotidyltransferase n=1 Tax=Gordonia sp. (in: high G+C Gram-positive bacteria) TaxID=84139 RepID=UPI0035272B30
MAPESSNPESSHPAVQALILVGGKGTRLRPLTLSAPKPMLPTAGVPFLTHLIARIREAGITDIVLGTSYQAEVFSEYYGDGSDLGVRLTYVTEKEALGTGGGIRNVYDSLTADTVLVFNGDVLGGTDIREVLDTHRTSGAEVTLHLVKVGDPRAFGCVPTDGDGRVTAFLEKTQDPPTNQINAGTYVFRRSVIGEIPAGRAVSVEREVFPRLLAEGRHIQGHVDGAYWRDMGTPEDFVRGSADLVRGIAPSPLLDGERGESLVKEGAHVAADAVLVGGTVVGADAQIGPGARLDGAVIFDGAIIEAGAAIERSIVGFGARVGRGALIRDTVIGDQAHIGNRCELLRGARVWPGVQIPETGIRFSTDV